MKKIIAKALATTLIACALSAVFAYAQPGPNYAPGLWPMGDMTPGDCVKIAGLNTLNDAPCVTAWYNSAGPAASVKCLYINVTTTTGGAWSVLFNSTNFPGFPGFTAPPNVNAQAVSTSNLLGGLLWATTTAPTAAGASGAVALAGIAGLGGAGSVVMVSACGV